MASFSLQNAKVGSVVSVGMETVKVTATGDNEVGAIVAHGATKFVFDGAGKLDTKLSNTAGNQAHAIVTDIDASAMKGSLDLTISTAELNTTGATIKGGTATDDVLNVNGNITSKMTVSGFETVGLKGGDADLTNVTGATTVANSGPTNLIVRNATGVTNLLMEGAGKDADLNEHMTLGGIDFKVKGATAQDALAVAINNDGVALGNTNANTEAVIKAGALTVNSVKNVTINAADADVVLKSLAADKMETLTVKATEDFSITAPVDFKNDTKVDMAGVVGAVTMEFGTITNTPIPLTHALTYTGSSAVDTLTFGALTGVAGKTITYDINTGAGNDVVNLAGGVKAAADAVLNLNLGDGDDTLVLGGTAITLAQSTGQTFDFGAGNNTLHLTGDKAFDLSAANVTGLGHIKIDKAGTSTSHLIINGDTAANLNTVSADAASTVLNVKMQGTADAGATLDVRGLTIHGTATLNITGSVGGDTITASKYGDTITGGKGADTITLGAGADTVVFSTAATNGVDIITGFTAGAGKDILKVKDVTALSGIVGAAGAAISGTGTALTDLSDASGTSDANLEGKIFTFTGTVEELQTHIVDASGAAKNYLADTKVALALVHAAGSDTYTIYTVTGATGATDSFDSIGTVGVTGAFTVDNFATA